MTSKSSSCFASLSIGDDLVRQYEENGAICLRAMVDAKWVERLRSATDRVIAARGQDFNEEGAKGQFLGDLDLWLRDPDFQAYALEGPCWQIAMSLMRSSGVQLFSDQLFVKEPGTSTPTPWHHDQTYWPVLGDQVCSIWLALDPVSQVSSGLEYIKGSHRWNRRFKPQAFGKRSVAFLDSPANEEMPDFSCHREEYEFLSWNLEPGDVLVHHSLTVHGAGGNRSRTTRRRALATRWLGDGVRFRPLSLFTEKLTGLAEGEFVANSKSLFPPVPLPNGRMIPQDYWPAPA